MTKKEFDQQMYAVVVKFRNREITSREAIEQRRAIYENWQKEGGRKCKRKK